MVHNELERMRRRLMGRLFKNLQYWALYTPDQSSADVVPVPKVAVLSIVSAPHDDLYKSMCTLVKVFSVLKFDFLPELSCNN